MYVTDTLGNPFVEIEEASALTRGISESRRQANEIKKKEKITVVIGNPPYKEKAKGKGGWVESGGSGQGAPLNAWIPPVGWKVGAHVKHLRNLYIYFWRWATWKVFDHNPNQSTGIVCFITVAGFLNGPGFQKMRDYLRRAAGEVWVIDCTPEGHQPGVNTRIFQGVQQPVCIVMVCARRRPTARRPRRSATVHCLQRIERRSSPRWPRSPSTTTAGLTARPSGATPSCPRPPARGRRIQNSKTSSITTVRACRQSARG